MNNSKTSEIFNTKQHFEILDGLRGVAALAVVVFHFMEWVYTDSSKNFIGHGFLAVDFFFCLSGFVIAYAYDEGIAGMGTVEFFKLRLIRLHPLVLLGSVLGLLGFLLDPFASHSIAYSAGRVLLIFICSIFLIPFPVMEDRFFNLFSFNAPSWSLFWEYVANILYAFILYRVGRKFLSVLVVLAAIGLCLVSYRAGNLVGGWAGSNFWDGGARIAYSFLAGMLIYRSNWIIKNGMGFVGLAVLLSLAFLMPFLKWNWLVEAMIVILYFPLLLALGAGSRLPDSVKAICQFSGKMSYPLYMTHYAGIWIFGNYLTLQKPKPSELPIIIPLGIGFLLLFAYLAMVLYDIPVRKYLGRKWLGHGIKPAAK